MDIKQIETSAFYGCYLVTKELFSDTFVMMVFILVTLTNFFL